MTGPARILIVDDEPQIHRFLRPSLLASGFVPISASTGSEALRSIASAAVDTVILDLGLPDLDGKDIIKAIRKHSAVPIIVLSARDREAEKIDALDLGADDYVNKPFAIGELLARIRSVLRRPTAERRDEPAFFALGPVLVDTRQHLVTRAGEAVHLTPKEFDLLVLLARHAGRVLTHRHILNDVWGPAHGGDTQYLRVFIGQLRQKLEVNPAEPQLILTEPGVGYRAAEIG
ncbi:MAG: response regulator transcription factor [Hyphomicrobium sp.]